MNLAPATTRPYGVIYKITCLMNGKIYVGKTTRRYPIQRWSEHKKCALVYGEHPRGKAYFYNALRKHGIENFRFEVIDQVVTDPELLAKEMYWIAALHTTDRRVGYNSTYGGESGIPTPETLKKLRGRPCSAETRARIAASQKGKKRVVTDAMRAAWTARRQNGPTLKMAEHLARMSSQPLGLGTKRTDEQRQRIRDGIRRAYANPELRAKVSAIQKASHASNPRPGHSLSEEHKRRVGDATRQRYANMTPEERQELSRQCSIRNSGRRQSPEEVARRKASIKAAWTDEKRVAWSRRLRKEGAIERIRQGLRRKAVA